MKFLVALVLALVVSPAHAVWSDAERAEMRKVISTGLLIQEVMRDLSNQAPSLAQPKSVVPTLNALVQMSMDIRNTFGCAVNADCPAASRGEQLAKMYNSMDSSLRYWQNAALVEFSRINNTVLADRIRVLPLDSFDRSLAYLDPLPPSFPNVVGPHGDLILARDEIQHTVEYAHHSQFNAIRLWQHTSSGNVVRIAGSVAAGSGAISKFFRVWGMTMDVTLPDDEATIQADTAFGSGLRPASFFRLLLEVEYLYGTYKNNTLFSGRRMKLGATNDVRTMTEHVVQYVRSLSTEELIQQTRGGSTSWGANVADGWGHVFFVNLTDFWQAMDIWGAGVMMFFRPPPSPPGT